MNRRMIAIAIALLVFPALLLAQGTSPVQVTGISISPATISPGTNVTITVNLRNGAATTYGCGSPGGVVTVYVFKGDQDTTANLVFQATQAQSPMPGGTTSTVTFSSHWTVPAGDVASYRVVAWSPTCAPDEFGERASLTLRRSCSYSATPLIKLPAIKLQRLP